jgi:hypothetical protein
MAAANGIKNYRIKVPLNGPKLLVANEETGALINLSFLESRIKNANLLWPTRVPYCKLLKKKTPVENLAPQQ